MNKFLKIFQITVFLSIFFVLSFNIVLATDGRPHLSTGADVLNIKFDTGCTPVTDSKGNQLCQINWIGQYISGIYRYGISLAAVLAVVMVMVGGFIWLSSGGTSTRIKYAQSIIGSAFAGLLLALFAFVILNTINPRLVSLDPLQIKSTKNQDSTKGAVGSGSNPTCCEYSFIDSDEFPICVDGVTSEYCGNILNAPPNMVPSKFIEPGECAQIGCLSIEIDDGEDIIIN